MGHNLEVGGTPGAGVIETTFTVLDADYEARARESYGRQGAMALLGATIEALAPGQCRIELDFRPELSQQHGYFHAGITSAIADSAGGYAALTLFPPTAEVLTVEFKINLIAPAHGERLIADAQVVRTGRTLTVCTVDVSCLRGDVL
ncbi:MAG: PaaI family thioesterase, partial [Candidatus Eremiobacteraeota bacterium]|nr:PaaI family thioesterase [Candidatus Eremiobacteraeota bacterium]